MKKKVTFGYEVPEELNHIEMTRDSSFHMSNREKATFNELKRTMSPEEMQYMCNFMWRMGYATAIKETGAEVPEHRRVSEPQKIN